jgi:2'-5' RNA ligase
MKRLFIAINLPFEIKEEIVRLVEQIDREKKFSQKQGFRWLTKENWHLTITFLGNQPEEAIPIILQSMEEVSQEYSTIFKNSGIFIRFEKIIFAPSIRPRMIWLTTAKETSETLNKLKNKLDESLIKSGIYFKKENRQFQGHLTLARFEPRAIKKTEILEVQDLIFQPKSFDLMESQLFRSGAEYVVIEKINFK